MLKFIKDYWGVITFFVAQMSTIITFIVILIKATKCSLRNDILEIYDKCKVTKQITHFQMESLEYSYSLYKKLKGNSFVDKIYKRVQTFELID